MHDLYAAHLISISTLGGSSEQKGKKVFFGFFAAKNKIVSFILVQIEIAINLQ